MKKLLPFLTIILLFTACKGWTEADRKSFMNSCVSEGIKNFDQAIANEYCACMLKKMEARYDKPTDAEKIPADTLQIWATGCLQ